MGPFDHNRLDKYLAGKKVALQFGVGNGTDYSSKPPQSKTCPHSWKWFMPLSHLLSPDAEEWKGIKSQIEMSLVNADKDPSDHLLQAQHKEPVRQQSLDQQRRSCFSQRIRLRPDASDHQERHSKCSRLHVCVHRKCGCRDSQASS